VRAAVASLLASIVVLGAMAGTALAQPMAPPPPADGKVVNTGCEPKIQEMIEATFSPAAMSCTKVEEPAPTDTNPNANAVKLRIIVGWKDTHIDMKARLDGTIESVTCPAAINKTIVMRFPPSRDPNAAAAPFTCMPGGGRTLKVDIPGKGVAQVQVNGEMVGMVTGNDDIIESGGGLMALLFWAFAAATVGGALFVITRRNLIAAVMGMVGSFLGIAATYMMLYAQFLAVIQMLVYAGAIMVLFVFVIMILNRPEDEPVAPSGRAGQALGGLAIVYLIGRLVMMLIHVRAPPNADMAPSQVALPAVGLDAHAEKVDWGSVKAVGMNLFGPGLFPFEAISILLLVAVVGAIAIARPTHHKDEPERAA
jgi:NADH-quinone oxidoreductase subunit J